MKSVIQKQFKSTIFLTFSLALLTACGGGGSSGKKDEKPAPTPLTGAAIANIDEASGICYSAKRDSLFVVSDKGVLFELDTSGQQKRQIPLRTNANKGYDSEGVACDDAHDRLVVAAEGKDNVLTLPYASLSIQKSADGNPTGDITRPADNTLYKDKKGKQGIEGIAIHDGIAYVSNQSTVPYPGKDSSFVFTLDDYTAIAPNVVNIFDHKQIDIAGLSFYKGVLYMVSGINKSLIAYDINTKSVLSTKPLPAEISVEGIAFDNSKHIYFADDKNGKVYKYPTSQFGIE